MSGDIAAVAFVGLGIMGLPMAGHLQAAGFPRIVNTRPRLKADALISAGAIRCVALAVQDALARARGQGCELCECRE